MITSVIHGVVVRYADKSGKAVLTYLDDDDKDILEKLNDHNYYDQLQNDPSDDIKVEIKEWTDNYKELNVIDEDIHKYVTDTEDTQAAKTKPLIKIHKPVIPETGRYKIIDLHPSTGTPTRNLSKFVQLSIKQNLLFI